MTSPGIVARCQGDAVGYTRAALLLLVLRMALALFDLDHTLLDGDSNSLWMHYLIERGHLDPVALETQAEYLRSTPPKRSTSAAYLNFHLGFLRERALEDWLPLRDAFIAEQIKPRLWRETEAAIAVVMSTACAVITRRSSPRRITSRGGHRRSLPDAGDRAVPTPARRPHRWRDRKHDLLPRTEDRLPLEAFVAREDWETEADDRHFYSDSINDLPNSGCRLATRTSSIPMSAWRPRPRCAAGRFCAGNCNRARLVRLIPVGADADFDDERYAQFGDLRHQRRQFDAHAHEFVVRHFEHQFVVHLHDQFASQLRVDPALHGDHRQLDEIGAAVPCIGALIAARSAPWRRPTCRADVSGSHRRRPNTVST